MLYNQFLNHLNKSKPAPAYLFVGGSDLLHCEAWKALLEEIVPPKALRFNGERLQAGECEVEDVINRMRILPMFGTRQLLMVQNIDVWKKEQKEALLAYLAQPNPNACLVLTTLSRKGQEKVEEAVSRHGEVVTFPALGDRTLPKWLLERVKSHGKQLSLQAAHYLLEQVGDDLNCLEREIEKLCLYVGERTKIEPKDLEETVSVQRSFTVFELMRYVGQKKTDKALSSLRNLSLSGQHPLAILSLLARQIRVLWQVSDGIHRGLSLSQISKEAGVHPYAMKDYAQQAPALTHEDLLAAHVAIRKADVRIKSTGANPALILEELIIGLCLEGSPPPDGIPSKSPRK